MHGQQASTHYAAIYACFPAKNELGYQYCLLGFGPYEDETKLGTAELHEYISFTLSVYDKSWSNVTCLIGDNCSVNKAVANLVGCPFVGCASHRFNLAVQDYINEHSTEVQMVNDLMKKFKYLIPAAKLRKHTPLCAITRNETRWSSIFAMLGRYLDLKDFIKEIAKEDADIRPLILTKSQDIAVQNLFTDLKKLDTVTLALQAEKCTIATVRYIFDEVMKDFPSMVYRLSPSADIVHNDIFEKGVVKIQEGNAGFLTEDEKKAVEKFKKNHADQHEICADDPIVSRACKRQKYHLLDSLAGYDDLRYILPSSNICERLFSMAGIALDSRRQRLLPSNFEAQMYLFANASFWDIQDISIVLSNDEQEKE